MGLAQAVACIAPESVGSLVSLASTQSIIRSNS
jgi:hypothetical protein